MLKRLRESLRRAFSGARLNTAIERNKRAADDLDALLQEVLKR